MVGYGGVLADMTLEKKLRVLHLYLSVTRSGLRVTLSKAWPKEASKPTCTVTHFLQQGYAYSSKAIPPNSAVPCEFMGANHIQITTVAK